MWNVPRMWEGGDVWILGGGPSLTEQFGIPNRVVQDVISEKTTPNVYSPYMSILHDKHVIAVNMAYKIGDWIDVVFFGDNGFFLREKLGLAAFPGIKVSCHPLCEKYSWIKYLNRDSSHSKGISNDPKRLSWNSNSGSAAINLAVHFGAKRIMLIGFDMKIDKEGKQHWHNLYHRMGRNPADRHPRRRPTFPFDRHLTGFPSILEDAKKKNVEILNICPDSEIVSFRKLTLKEFLQENPSYVVNKVEHMENVMI